MRCPKYILNLAIAENLKEEPSMTGSQERTGMGIPREETMTDPWTTATVPLSAVTMMTARVTTAAAMTATLIGRTTMIDARDMMTVMMTDVTVTTIVMMTDVTATMIDTTIVMTTVPPVGITMTTGIGHPVYLQISPQEIIMTNKAVSLKSNLFSDSAIKR